MTFDLTVKMEHILIILTIIISGLVGFVAYAQFIIARERFKLDLFEKRFAVYKGVQSLLLYIFEQRIVTMDEIIKYRSETQDAPFLFNDDIQIYLDKINKNVLSLLSTTAQLKEEPKGSGRKNLVTKESELLLSLTSELRNLQNIFSSYLKFKTWK